MLLLFPLVLGCAQDPDAVSPTPEAPAGGITADDVLQRHLDASNQCALLTAENYTLQWEAVTTDKQSTAKQEKILQQGRQGKAFARLHQEIRPKIRFSGFGLSPDGTWWSAGDAGVQANLPEEVRKPLSVYLDPTPVCAFQARWADRDYVGEEDWEGHRAHHVRGTWADGTSTDMWFDTDTGLMVGAKTAVGENSDKIVMRKYNGYGDIKWPAEVFTTRIQGDLHVFTAQKLEKLDIAVEGFRDIGHPQVAAIIAERNKDLKQALSEKAPE